jgi:ureidoacrylate peracid hydrolase
MQKDYCHPDGVIGKTGIEKVQPVIEMTPRLKNLLQKMRAIGVTIIHVVMQQSKYSSAPTWLERYKRYSMSQPCQYGTWGAEIIDELKPLANEKVVVKHRYSAFIDTDLNLILRSMGIENILMTGTMTRVCVETSARDGFMLDYRTITISDCVADGSEEAHTMALKTLDTFFGYVTDSATVIKALE